MSLAERSGLLLEKKASMEPNHQKEKSDVCDEHTEDRVDDERSHRPQWNAASNVLRTVTSQ